MNQSLLHIQNLSISFLHEREKQNVVKDISFHINRGEIVGLVGESGSGKSVTALSLMQLLPKPQGCIDHGKIIFHEKETKTDLLSLPDEDVRKYRGKKMGMIFQEPMSSLNPVFTCGNQIIETLRLHQNITRSQAEEQVISLFRQVHLPQPEKMIHRYPHQLSGGQKQRVMIAMAISCRPDLIIADEPTTALDVTVQKAILDLLKELREELNISVLFITHDLGVVSEIADRVLVMYKGKIVEQGPLEEIFTDPKHPYTKGLLACRPPTDRLLKKLPVMSDFMEVKGNELVEKNTDINTLMASLELNPEKVWQRQQKMLQAAPILQVKDLMVRFPGKKNFLGKVQDWTYAVNGVSFDLYPGETLGLAGESGCGKTTLGRAILQLIPATSGQVIYHGTDLCKMPDETLRKLRKKVQIIFQDPYSSLNPRLTIGEALMEPMQVHQLYRNDKSRKRKARELLEKVNLDPQIFRGYPHEFSGGQRQRICVARALALEPDFIICDEAVSALDVSVQAQVLNLLLQLKEEFHFSCIFISHDLSVVKFMCDRIMVMNKGKVVEIGNAEEVYHRPESDYTRKLIAAIPGG